MEDLNFSSCWISKVLKSDIPFSIKNKKMAVFLKLNLLPNIFFVLLVLNQDITNGVTFTIFTIVLWLNIAPYLIYYYDEKLIPQFFRDISFLIPDVETRIKLAEKYDKMFAEKWWIPTSVWTLGLLLLFLSVSQYLQTLGLFNLYGFFFWYFLIIVLWLGIFSGIGFMGVITTILTIKEIATLHLDIDPLHPDKLGGLSCFGTYAIGTTILFSSGSIMLPGILRYVQVSANAVYLIVSIYMLFIAISFVYPTYKIHAKAKSIKDRKLDNLRIKYMDAKKNLRYHERAHPEPDMGEMILEMKIQRARQEYKDYKNMQAYPMNIETLIRLIGSVFAPPFLIFLEVFLRRTIQSLAI